MLIYVILICKNNGKTFLEKLMLEIKILKTPQTFAANSYLISSAGEYAIIDPTAPYDKEICSGQVKYILLTHAHFDHILEVDSWVSSTGAQVIISENGVEALRDPIRNCFKLFFRMDNGYFGKACAIKEDEILPFGEETIRFISTPGHTSCSGVFICGNNAFVGDTVFSGGGFGRFDLPTGNYDMLMRSIDKIFKLPDEMTMYPGHGGSTTVKQYKQEFKR